MSGQDKKIKRPVNVDLEGRLRVIGQSRASFQFVSDEGDGYDIFALYKAGEGPHLMPKHFEEWAEQLEYVAEWCRKKAAELSKNNSIESKED